MGDFKIFLVYSALTALSLDALLFLRMLIPFNLNFCAVSVRIRHNVEPQVLGLDFLQASTLTHNNSWSLKVSIAPEQMHDNMMEELCSFQPLELSEEL